MCVNCKLHWMTLRTKLHLSYLSDEMGNETKIKFVFGNDFQFNEGLFQWCDFDFFLLGF